MKLQQVNGLGQGLIQSAGKNCDVQGLEHDMEEINARWNTLNKKASGQGVTSALGMEGLEKAHLNPRFPCNLNASTNLAVVIWNWGGGRWSVVIEKALSFLIMSLCICDTGRTKDCTTAGGFVALWEVSRCLGAVAQLVGRH